MTAEAKESIQQAYLDAHSQVVSRLKLDVGQDGASIATLIQSFYDADPENWEDKLEETISECERIEKEDSLKEAMLYLGAMIDRINYGMNQRLHKDNPARLAIVNRFTEVNSRTLRESWPPTKRAIPGSVSNLFVPDWWWKESEQKETDGANEISTAIKDIHGRAEKV